MSNEYIPPLPNLRSLSKFVIRKHNQSKNVGYVIYILLIQFCSINNYIFTLSLINKDKTSIKYAREKDREKIEREGESERDRDKRVRVRER